MFNSRGGSLFAVRDPRLVSVLAQKPRAIIPGALYFRRLRRLAAYCSVSMLLRLGSASASPYAAAVYDNVAVIGVGRGRSAADEEVVDV